MGKEGRPLRIFNRIIILTIIFLFAGLFFNGTAKNNNGALIKKKPSKQSTGMITQNQINRPGNPITERPKEGVSILIGQGVSELEKEMGKPLRIDQTDVGYQWYIFKNDAQHYLQAGVENNRVVTVYALGEDLNVVPFEIGQPLEEIFNTQYIDSNIDINYNGNSYRFELNDTDINLRPLVQLGDVYAQLYFDKSTGILSSVRFMDAATLLKLRPYQLVYHGALMKPANVTPAQMEESGKGTEKERKRK